MMLIKFARPLLTIVSLAWMALLAPTATGWANRSQKFPEPPSDLTRVYYLSADNQLLPLPFESGVTLSNVFLPAKRDEIARVVLKGSTARTVLTNNNYMQIHPLTTLPPGEYAIIGDSLSDMATFRIQ